MGEAYALSGDRRVRGNSGYAKKVTIRRILTLWRPQMVDQVRTRKKRGPGMASSPTIVDHRMRDSSEHRRKRPSEGHSLPGDRRGETKSEHIKKVTVRGTPTSW